MRGLRGAGERREESRDGNRRQRRERKASVLRRALRGLLEPGKVQNCVSREGCLQATFCVVSFCILVRDLGLSNDDMLRLRGRRRDGCPDAGVAASEPRGTLLEASAGGLHSVRRVDVHSVGHAEEEAEGGGEGGFLLAECSEEFGRSRRRQTREKVCAVLASCEFSLCFQRGDCVRRSVASVAEAPRQSHQERRLEAQ
ncbi:hypothetical protein TGPRC2_426400 [Toxoplasma gondii TgCatPRC2]|uniref:Uncharacterized protein n=1 Tax=Toxoplasma gondii TgCatPRC2 TaxID=1130821 RepID=A0A151H4Q8_TOXGO|nr:hypothetical protein TGPRC2_426400 [Toxoplasma gondii TgCatPRC2]